MSLGKGSPVAAPREQVGGLSHARVTNGSAWSSHGSPRRARPAIRARPARPSARAEHLDALADGSRHRPRVVEARCEREAALERDEPELGLKPTIPQQAAGIGWSRPIGAERRVGEARGERGRRASARPAAIRPGTPGWNGPVMGVHRREMRLPVGGSARTRVSTPRCACSRSATMAPRNVSQTISQRDSSSDTVMPELKA